MNSHIYLDESGDLGWKLKTPYRNGGSSRYLTIAYIVCPLTNIDKIKNLVKRVYRNFNFPFNQEFKASDLQKKHKDFICAQTVSFLKANPDIHLGSVTVKKENVKERHKDEKKLYNFMIGHGILDVIEPHDTCKITRDKRAVKKIQENNCIDYLQTLMWYHRDKGTILKDNPTDSHTDFGLIFIDWITNIVWSKYEDKASLWCDTITPHITEVKLYFSPAAIPIPTI